MAEFVVTGDVIPTQDNAFLIGHGTKLVSMPSRRNSSNEEGKGDTLIATVTGVVERVNKLISVKPMASRYSGEVGDVIVGRIKEVADKKWKVDINARQHAVLMISSVNLPGGVQRRRTNEDSLQMRQYLAENDLVSAEVQKVMQDRSVSLHTRSLKYGKLENGQFLQVSPALIRRRKNHFNSLPNTGVDVIIGVNGFIYLTATPSEEEKEAIAKAHEDAEQETPMPLVTITEEVRESIARVRNCIIALSKAHIQIYADTIMDVYEESLNLQLRPHDILNSMNIQQVTQSATLRASEN